MIKTYSGTVLKICLILFVFLFYLPRNSCAIQSIYTIQTGSFDSEAAAGKQFDSIVQGLDEKTLDSLRIETIGDFYSVRIGKFKGYSAAVKLMKIVKPRFSKAFIIEAYMKDERIIKL